MIAISCQYHIIVGAANAVAFTPSIINHVVVAYVEIARSDEIVRNEKYIYINYQACTSAHNKERARNMGMTVHAININIIILKYKRMIYILLFR